eukprot:s642_g22.t1
MSDMEVELLSGKRGPQEGTPDREATARSKVALHAPVPQPSFPETTPAPEVSTVDARLSHLENHSDHDDLANRLARVEELLSKERFVHDEEEVIDKSMVVLGGFTEKSMEEVEVMVGDLMKHVHGFKEVRVTNNDPPIAFARFETPVQAMKCIRGQKANAEMQRHKLWASENKSSQERFRCKAVSKLKNFLLELEAYDPKDAVLNYKTFKVTTRRASDLSTVPNRPV